MKPPFIFIIGQVVLGLLTLAKVRSEVVPGNRIQQGSLALSLLWCISCLAGVTWGALLETWRFFDPRVQLIGYAAAGIGVGILGWTIVTFQSLLYSSGTKTSFLIHEGPYKIGRYPGRLAWLLILIGGACATGSYYGLGQAGLFWIGVRMQLVYEESYLQRIYGQRWLKYRNLRPPLI